MADITPNGQAGQPQLVLQKIYVKDASFEAPNAPQVFQEMGETEAQPQVQLNLGHKAVDLGNEQFEVVLSLTSRNVDTCENRQGKWVALLAVSAAIVRDPPVAKIDSASLADFVGTYVWTGAPNIETVFRKGDRLYIQGTWEDSPTELLPEKPDTFFVRGEGAGPQSRVAFLRDEGGRVIGERVYSPADGQGYNTRRIK